MKKGKVIKEILGKIFFDKGFNYKTMSGMWIFERKYQNKVGEMIDQQIYVQKSNFDKRLYFRLQTNAYGRVMVDAQKIVQDTQMVFSYETEQEFVDWIKYFSNLMESKGFDVLEQISEPTVVDRPTASQEEYLYQNYTILAEEFMKEYDVSLDCSETQLLEVVFNLIKPLKNKSYQDVSDVLIKLSAFYGQWFKEQKDGKWHYEKDLGTTIKFMEDSSYLRDKPILSRIFLCWQRIQEFNEIQYKELQQSILLI